MTGGEARSSGLLRTPRQYGVADLDDDGEWVVGDLSRLDPV
jgi:hypothetical protein